MPAWDNKSLHCVCVFNIQDPFDQNADNQQCYWCKAISNSLRALSSMNDHFSDKLFSSILLCFIKCCFQCTVNV